MEEYGNSLNLKQPSLKDVDVGVMEIALGSIVWDYMCSAKERSLEPPKIVIKEHFPVLTSGVYEHVLSIGWKAFSKR